MVHCKIQTIALIPIPENAYFHLYNTVINTILLPISSLNDQLSNFCKNDFSCSEESTVNGEY